MTNPLGYVFISYRSTQLSPVLRLRQRLSEYGIPLWHDQSNMPPGMLEEGMAEAIKSDDCSGAVVWLSRDVQNSDAIQQIELPEIFRRIQKDETFIPVFCLADGLGFDEAQTTILSRYSNVSLKSYLLQPFRDPTEESKDIEDLAMRILAWRLQLIHSALPEGDSLKIHIAGHVGPIRSSHYSLSIDYHTLFHERFAADDDWQSKILPALDSIAAAIAQNAPGRPILIDGSPQISLALAFGYALRTPRRIPVKWLQPSPDASSQEWTIDSSRTDNHFVLDYSVDRLRGHDIAVLIGVTQDPQPTFDASTSTLPKFGAVIRVNPASGEYPARISTSNEASSVSQAIVAKVRGVVTEYRLKGSIHLFIAGPAGLAFLIGQQLNTFGTITVYEHVADGPIGLYRQSLQFNS